MCRKRTDIAELRQDTYFVLVLLENIQSEQDAILTIMENSTIIAEDSKKKLTAILQECYSERKAVCLKKLDTLIAEVKANHLQEVHSDEATLCTT